MAETGMKPNEVCLWLQRVEKSCDLVVGHNVAFDIKIMDIEFREAGLNSFAPEKVFCTMKASTDLCRLPGKGGDYKFPRLEEALRLLCGTELKGGHDALVDTRACKELFLELQRRRHLDGRGRS